jgi:hypothetical protein
MGKGGALRLIGSRKPDADGGYILNAAFAQRALGQRPGWLKVVK